MGCNGSDVFSMEKVKEQETRKVRVSQLLALAACRDHENSTFQILSLFSTPTDSARIEPIAVTIGGHGVRCRQWTAWLDMGAGSIKHCAQLMTC